MLSTDLLDQESIEEWGSLYLPGSSRKIRESPAAEGLQMKDNDSWIRSLLIDVRRYQHDTNLLSRTITDQQLRAVQTRIHETKMDLSRAQRLECLRMILGYEFPIKSTWDLSMADAKGLIELADDEFLAVFMWSAVEQESGALV
jgi:hypothetical protein